MPMKMKNILLAAILFVVCGQFAGAQVMLGAKAGIAASWIPGTLKTDPAERSVPHNNFYAGLTSEFMLGDRFCTQVDLLYTAKGYSSVTELPGFKDRYSLNLGYLQLPVLFGVKMAQNRYTICVGPEFGLNLFSKFAGEENGIPYDGDALALTNRFNLALVLQTTYMFTDNLGVDVRFDWGATRTFKQKYEQFREDGHNMSLMLGLCYKFEL